MVNKINFQKWYSQVKIIIDNDFELDTVALIDTGADVNCIQDGIIPTKFYQKTIERLSSANGGKMKVKYKLPNVYICQDNVCFKTSFVLVQDMTDEVILGLPFVYLLYPFTTDIDGVTTKPFGQSVTFRFISKPEVKKLRQLKDHSISKYLRLINQKTKHVKFLKE